MPFNSINFLEPKITNFLWLGCKLSRPCAPLVKGFWSRVACWWSCQVRGHPGSSSPLMVSDTMRRVFWLQEHILREEHQVTQITCKTWQIHCYVIPVCNNFHGVWQQEHDSLLQHHHLTCVVMATATNSEKKINQFYEVWRKKWSIQGFWV